LLQRSVRSMLVVEGLELAERAEEVALVPDQRSVEEFVPAGLYPALHDGVHARDADTAFDDLESGVGEYGVEGGRKLGIAVADQEPDVAACVFEVHDEVASELYHPLRGGVCGGAEDSDAPGGVPDDGEDVQVRTGQGDCKVL
jgi:hypothetical protein